MSDTSKMTESDWLREKQMNDALADRQGQIIKTLRADLASIAGICNAAGIGPVATVGSVAGDDAVGRVLRLAAAKKVAEEQWKAATARPLI